jgi:endonuclease-3
MRKIKNIDEIINILKKETTKHQIPLVSRNKWKIIPKTPYTVLISCLLSLRTKDEITEKTSIKLLTKHNTAEKILKLTEKQIQDLIYPVGFYKTKAKRIKQISNIIQKQYNGKVPENINELLKLKGVGRKTANIVMVYGFNKDEYLPIDTHCHRIPNRIGWIKTKNPEETEQELKQILPKKYFKDFNHLFVIYGQTICLPISPYCSKCNIRKYCKQIKVIKKR